MQFFPVGKVYDFMGQRRLFVGVSVVMVVLSVIGLFFPGPKLGTDFRVGTEIEVAFKKPVSSQQIRDAVTSAGFSRPDVIRVDDPNNPNRYLVRVEEVTTFDEPTRQAVQRAVCYGDNLPADACPEERQATEATFSPGGAKITLRFRGEPDLQWLREQVSAVPGVELRAGENNPSVQNARDHKVEVQLKSRGDQLIDGLRAAMGPDTVPAAPLRVEWIGPKAG